MIDWKILFSKGIISREDNFFRYLLVFTALLIFCCIFFYGSITPELQRLLTVTGLFFDIVGACLLIYSLVVDDKKAIKLESEEEMFHPSQVDDFDDKTLNRIKQSPNIHDRIQMARFTVVGFIFISIGFGLQIIANLQPIATCP